MSIRGANTRSATDEITMSASRVVKCCNASLARQPVTGSVRSNDGSSDVVGREAEFPLRRVASTDLGLLGAFARIRLFSTAGISVCFLLLRAIASSILDSLNSCCSILSKLHLLHKYDKDGTPTMTRTKLLTTIGQTSYCDSTHVDTSNVFEARTGTVTRETNALLADPATSQNNPGEFCSR